MQKDEEISLLRVVNRDRALDLKVESSEKEGNTGRVISVCAVCRHRRRRRQTRLRG